MGKLYSGSCELRTIPPEGKEVGGHRSLGLGLAVRVFGLLFVAAVLVLSTLAAAQPTAHAASDPTVSEHLVTGTGYVRQDGGSDKAIARCSNLDPNTGASARQQNEPSVAINPLDPMVIVAGSNDYCTVPTFKDAWMGLYVSVDGGATWMHSLNPGYPVDTSAAGMASPIFGLDTASGDPIMGWDLQGNMFYGGIAFNRVATNPGGQTLTFGNMIVSSWHSASTAPLGIQYDRTVIVGIGTPAPNFEGLFNDKPTLTVDTWASSPFKNNVYVAWTLFPGAGADKILFSRSTDHGKTFSPPLKISSALANAQGSDIAVAPDGTVYVVWRQFAFGPAVPNAVVFVKSSDGGMTFSAPKIAQTINGYDRSDQYVSGGVARDCGSLIFACVSGFTFPRTDALPAAVADDLGAVYIAWEQLFPMAPNADTYHPDGQAQVMISKSSNGGMSWSTPNKADPNSAGDQFWPNLAFDKSAKNLALIYYDSREDSTYSVNRPPGNTAAGTSPCLPAGATVANAACDVLNTFVAVSSDHGTTWSSTKVSSMGHQPNYEMFGTRRVPFQGDYLWIDAAGGRVFGVWTDNRNVVPGEDLRETQPGGPSTAKMAADGFDVKQCHAWNTSTLSWGTDTCPNAGGLDQNIYGASLG